MTRFNRTTMEFKTSNTGVNRTLDTVSTVPLWNLKTVGHDIIA